ncbi:hypothetical protein C0J52_19120 [Blattella germanica]|nr:hypothetical protein C0J52_19120 [Blattella germanica]
MAELSPFVYWAQTEDNVTLKVDLKDVKNPDISLGEKKLKFSGHGYGAKGQHDYHFILNFHSALNPEDSKYKLTDRQVEFTLKKETNGWWPRLTATPQKPAWLKIDFDRWKMEDVDDEDEPRDVLGDYPDLYEKLEKEELGYRKEDLKKVYLIFYNLCQFIGFTYILTVMAIRYFRDGPGFVNRHNCHYWASANSHKCVQKAQGCSKVTVWCGITSSQVVDSMEGTYDAVGGAMKFCQLMQFLEFPLSYCYEDLLTYPFLPSNVCNDDSHVQSSGEEVGPKELEIKISLNLGANNCRVENHHIHTNELPKTLFLIIK